MSFLSMPHVGQGARSSTSLAEILRDLLAIAHNSYEVSLSTVTTETNAVTSSATAQENAGIEGGNSLRAQGIATIVGGVSSVVPTGVGLLKGMSSGTEIESMEKDQGNLRTLQTRLGEDTEAENLAHPGGGAPAPRTQPNDAEAMKFLRNRDDARTYLKQHRADFEEQIGPSGKPLAFRQTLKASPKTEQMIKDLETDLNTKIQNQSANRNFAMQAGSTMGQLLSQLSEAGGKLAAAGFTEAQAIQEAIKMIAQYLSDGFARNAKDNAAKSVDTIKQSIADALTALDKDIFAAQAQSRSV
jgi:hypothetical protein